MDSIESPEDDESSDSYEIELQEAGCCYRAECVDSENVPINRWKTLGVATEEAGDGDGLRGEVGRREVSVLRSETRGAVD